MREFLSKTIAAASLVGSVLLAGCGGGGENANNAADEITANGSGGIPVGNDASAMEVAGNQVAPAEPMPSASGNGSVSGNSSGDESLPPPAPAPDDSPPGGDRGGNSAQGNVSAP